MGYLPGFATPRIVCDVPYVGKRWVHQVAEYDRERGICYWTKNYRTGIERDDEDALDRRYAYYDPIATLPESGQAWWRGARGATRWRAPTWPPRRPGPPRPPTCWADTGRRFPRRVGRRPGGSQPRW